MSFSLNPLMSNPTSLHSMSKQENNNKNAWNERNKIKLNHKNVFSSIWFIFDTFLNRLKQWKHRCTNFNNSQSNQWYSIIESSHWFLPSFIQERNFYTKTKTSIKKIKRWVVFLSISWIKIYHRYHVSIQWHQC